MDNRMDSRRLRAAVAALPLLLISATGYAQTTLPPPGGQWPLTVELVRNPFIVATDYKVTGFDGEVGQLWPVATSDARARTSSSWAVPATGS